MKYFTKPTAMVDVVDDNICKMCDGAFTISCDHIEPFLHIGDLVGVIKQDDIEVGEFGVYIINGKSCMRQKGNGVIRSMNPNIADVPIDDSVICVGKVLGKLRQQKDMVA